MEVNERILAIVKEKGPVLPVQVAKEINDSILMTSARLSELLTSKQIKISSLKVGGSPLYYHLGQEDKLQNFVDNLNGTERKAYNLLLENKLLKDSNQEPAIRVALRQIKDFAIPLQVNYENKIDIFWKWYLTGSKEAEPIIKDILSKQEKATPQKIPQPIEKPIGKKPIEQVAEKPNEPSKETEKGLEKSGAFQKEIKKEIPIELKEDTTKIKKAADKTSFLRQINGFFSKNKINIIETKEIKKNSEMNFIIGLETQIGNVRYFCKSKNKKKINESDLSTALINAQSKNLPLLFLTTGKISKKTKEQLNTDFKNIVYREI